MRVRVVVPGRTVLEAEAVKVVAEGVHGAFGVLPRHIDCAALLVPGLLQLTLPDGGETFLAVDEGLLVKAGEQVRVAVRDATPGRDLGELERTVREHFRALDQREARVRSALERLEVHMVRHFVELRESGV